MTDDQPIPPAPQTQKDSNNDAANPDGNAISEVKIPPSHKYYAVTCKGKRDKWDIAKLVAEFVGLGFLIAYTLYTAGIYSANRDAAKATQDTFGEIKKQTTMMRQQLVGTQAAVLDYSTPTWRGPAEGDEGSVSETLINHGLVSAKDASLEITITHERLSDFQPLEPPVKLHKGPEIVRVADRLVLEWHMPWKMKVIPGLLQDWPKDWPGTEVTEINAVYTYNDGFDDPVKKQFCFRWLPAFNYAMPNGSQGIGGMPTCEDTRSFIQWCLAKRKEIDAKRKEAK